MNREVIVPTALTPTLKSLKKSANSKMSHITSHSEKNLKTESNSQYSHSATIDQSMVDLNNTPDCRMSQTLSLLRSFSKYSPNQKKFTIKKCYPRNVSNTPLPKSSDPLPNVPLESIEHEESVELQSEVEIKLDPSAKFESEVKIDFVEEADELNSEPIIIPLEEPKIEIEETHTTESNLNSLLIDQESQEVLIEPKLEIKEEEAYFLSNSSCDNSYDVKLEEVREGNHPVQSNDSSWIPPKINQKRKCRNPRKYINPGCYPEDKCRNVRSLERKAKKGSRPPGRPAGSRSVVCRPMGRPVGSVLSKDYFQRKKQFEMKQEQIKQAIKAQALKDQEERRQKRCEDREQRRNQTNLENSRSLRGGCLSYSDGVVGK